MMVVLDTNVVSEVLRARPDERVLSYVHGVSRVATLTAITKAELLSGVRALPAGRRRDQLEVAIADALGPFEAGLLPFDGAAADVYATLTTDRARAGRPITMADGQIAGICLAHGAVLATRNVRDFDGLGLDLVDPWNVDV